MQKNNMKNIVVLKNLPSNIVDEAIIILKANKNAKKLQYVDNNSNVEYGENRKTNDYVIREAESIISNYIAKIENNKRMKNRNLDLKKRFDRLKIYCICISIVLFLSIIKNITSG